MPRQSRQALADLADLGDVTGHRLDMSEHDFALPRRLARAVDRLEQPDAERALDARQTPPHRGLVDAQPRRCAGIGAGIPDRGNDAQIVPVHAHRLS